MMQQLYDYQPVTTNLCLKQVLVEQLKMSYEELPISGGWGYTKEDCIIIHKKESSSRSIFSNGIVNLEYLIAEKRIFAELITLRSREEMYCDMSRRVIKQETIKSDGRWYDHLIFRVDAFKYDDFMMLSTEFAKRKTDIHFADDAFEQKMNQLKYWYEAEYWFDITEVYGQH